MTDTLRDRLPHLHPAEAALIGRAAESLPGRLRPARGASAAWIAFEAEPGGWRAWIAPLRGPDGPLRLMSDEGQVDALRAIAAMEQIEQLLTALERSWAVALRPVAIESACPASVIVEIEQDGLAALLGVRAEQAAIAPDLPAPSAERLAALPLPSHWRLQGPALPMGRLARLQSGDLLLLPSACPATLTAGGAGWRARADLHGRTLALDSIGPDKMANDKESWAGARTPVDIVIDAGPIAIGRLAALAPGSVLTLDGAGDTLAVELRAAGLRIGRGELVAVGDSFGVILSSVEPIATPADEPQDAVPAETADA